MPISTDRTSQNRQQQPTVEKSVGLTACIPLCSAGRPCGDARESASNACGRHWQDAGALALGKHVCGGNGLLRETRLQRGVHLFERLVTRVYTERWSMVECDVRCTLGDDDDEQDQDEEDLMLRCRLVNRPLTRSVRVNQFHHCHQLTFDLCAPRIVCRHHALVDRNEVGRI
ncbi:unnamed protein product [Sphagnum balticum]